jgi:transposase InsO family protein
MWKRAFFGQTFVEEGIVIRLEYEGLASLLGSHKGQIVDQRGRYSNLPTGKLRLILILTRKEFAEAVRTLRRARPDEEKWRTRAGLDVVPTHVVCGVRASLFNRDQPASKEALVAHPRAKLTVEGRRLLVERVRVDGWTVATAAEAQGCSRATAHKWLRRFDAEGHVGLIDRSSRPHWSPRRLSPEREGAILDRRQVTLEGPHRIAWALGESRSTVYQVLRRYRVPRLADLDRPTRTVVRYERERPGELVHVDVKKLGRIPEGGGHRVVGRRQGTRNKGHRYTIGYDFLHVAVDDRSRVAYVEVHADERDHTAAGFMSRAVGWFAQRGVPVERVLTDNGNCYRSRTFREVLVTAGVTHKRTRPYRPQTNGKVERFNLTLKHEWAYAGVYSCNLARLEALTTWLHHYNHHRPHMAHDGGAPMSVVNNVPGKHT